jgi:energy-coupling factor transport system ATP-binding protein
MVLTVSSLGLSLGGERRPVFDGVSCALEEGRIGLVEGRAGSGKTAFGVALCGLLPLWAGRFELRGSIKFLGAEVVQGVCPPETGVILENPYSQLSGLADSALGELAFPLECRGTGRNRMLRDTGRAADALGIAHLLDRRVRTLSGGELQRLLIACALVTGPRFLFLDRPLTEIDPGFRPEILHLLREHVRETRGAALLAEDPWLLPGESFDTIIPLGAGEEQKTGVRFPLPPLQGKAVERSAPSGDLLAVKDLTFAYPGGPDILVGLSFSIGHGEIVFLTGTNGAGKTTLARILAGILTPSHGEINLEGKSYKSLTRRTIMARIGLAFQNAALHFTRGTVREELALSAEWGFPAGNLIALLGLNRLLGSHPLELSQAERKRLSVALAAGGRRSAVILDEPSQYQDGDGFRMLLEAIRYISSTGAAVLLISHDPRLFAAFPDSEEIRMFDRLS